MGTNGKSTARAQIPLYLQIDYLRITKSFKDVLARYSRDEQKKLCYIQSIVITHTKDKPRLFAPIGAKTFHNKFTDYRKYVNILVELGELEIFRHWNNRGNKRFPMSYRIPFDRLLTGLTAENFKIKRMRVAKQVAVQSQLLNQNIENVKRSYDLLRVLPDFITTGKESTDIKSMCYLRRIAQGNYRFSKGEASGRISHPLILMPADGRVNLRHKDNLALKEYDIKTAHPFFLLHWAQDVSERQAYGALIANGDIYNHVGKWARSKKTRANLKIDFARFYNGGRENIFGKYFKEHFPRMYLAIREGEKSNSKTLLNIESEVISKLGDFCADKGYFHIPMYDGYVALESEAFIIEEHLRSLIFIQFNLNATIISKDSFNCSEAKASKANAFTTTDNNNIKAFINSSIYVVNKECPPKQHCAPIEKKPRILPDWVKQKIRRKRQAEWANPEFMANYRATHCFLIKNDFIGGDMDTL